MAVNIPLLKRINSYKTFIGRLKKNLLLGSLFTVSFSSVAFDVAPSDFIFYPKTTYEKYLNLAQAGDIEAQNLLGYMLYYGEAVQQNFEEAHYWFHEAAEMGNIKAQYNLGLFHARVDESIPERYFDQMESNKWLSIAEQSAKGPRIQYENAYDASEDYFQNGTPIENGEHVYQSFCAGCHGFDGMAGYKAAPSFLKGERLSKTDNELLKSIEHGVGLMPAWKDILSPELREYALLYIRDTFTDPEKVKATLSQLATKDTSLSPSALGAKVYSQFCAGCHGFNGIAYYVNSPSFALGQRMNKHNNRLANAVTNGYNVMPGWGDILTPREVYAVVGYIRTLEANFSAGIDRKLNKPLGVYYVFRPRDR